MKKLNVFLCVLVILLSCIIVYLYKDTINFKKEICTLKDRNNITTIYESDDNPIDKYYKDKFDFASSTYEINDVTSKYLEAWENELINVIELSKSYMKYDEDKLKFNSYYTLVKQQALNIAEIEQLNWVDIEQKVDQRFAGTGSNSACMMAMANVYKNAVKEMINNYEYGEKTYTFSFKKE